MTLWGRIKRIFQPPSETPILELIEAERKFLTWWATEGQIGQSSLALVRHVLDGTAIDWYPHDRSDLGRCYAAYDHAPPHLQKRMRPVMAKFEEAVEQHGAEVRSTDRGYYTSDRRFWQPETTEPVDHAERIADRMAKASRRAAEDHER